MAVPDGRGQVGSGPGHSAPRATAGERRPVMMARPVLSPSVGASLRRPTRRRSRRTPRRRRPGAIVEERGPFSRDGVLESGVSRESTSRTCLQTHFEHARARRSPTWPSPAQRDALPRRRANNRSCVTNCSSPNPRLLLTTRHAQPTRMGGSHARRRWPARVSHTAVRVADSRGGPRAPSLAPGTRELQRGEPGPVAGAHHGEERRGEGVAASTRSGGGGRGARRDGAQKCGAARSGRRWRAR